MCTRASESVGGLMMAHVWWFQEGLGRVSRKLKASLIDSLIGNYKTQKFSKAESLNTLACLQQKRGLRHGVTEAGFSGIFMTHLKCSAVTVAVGFQIIHVIMTVVSLSLSCSRALFHKDSTHMSACMCVCVCMYVCMYVCMHACMCVRMHAHIQAKSKRGNVAYPCSFIPIVHVCMLFILTT